jgi:hypothetical protein
VEDEVITLDTKPVQPVVLENKQPCADIRGKRKRLDENVASFNLKSEHSKSIKSHSKPYLLKL